MEMEHGHGRSTGEEWAHTLAGLSLRGGGTFVTPTETNVHGDLSASLLWDLLYFKVWRLAVGGGWRRLAAVGGWRLVGVSVWSVAQQDATATQNAACGGPTSTITRASFALHGSPRGYTDPHRHQMIPPTTAQGALGGLSQVPPPPQSRKFSARPPPRTPPPRRPRNRPRAHLHAGPVRQQCFRERHVSTGRGEHERGLRKAAMDVHVGAWTQRGRGTVAGGGMPQIHPPPQTPWLPLHEHTPTPAVGGPVILPMFQGP